jgi:malonyl-CoA/methylmalonyl-CoA synthetase
MELIRRANQFAARPAIISDNQSFTYAKLLNDSAILAARLCADQGDLNEQPIAFMVNPSYHYTVVQWAIWRAGGIAVPLHPAHPLPSLQHVIRDTGTKTIITDKANYSSLIPLTQEPECTLMTIDLNVIPDPQPLPAIENSRRAMILYTSGTTNQPKGVVTTHDNISSQIKSLVEAWQWSDYDHILNILPLHHVHGIINVMSCALWSGACCEFIGRFDPEKVWSKFMKGNVNVFMAVPTIYYKLIKYFEQADKDMQKSMSASCKGFRLMVSGSAALPIATLEQWRTISGMTLLERYGMTEIGMGLSNPYDGNRRPGHVGLPLPGVEVRLMNEGTRVTEENIQGEIQVKGPSVFLEYWNNPQATQSAFTADGWFMTGDIALINDGYYKILGRDSVDIIKSGGYKISALEIEDILLSYPGIKECAVIGIPDEEWGEIVAACLVIGESEINIDHLKGWISQQLATYKCPRIYKIRQSLPRNALGKVTKKELKKIFQ